MSCRKEKQEQQTTRSPRHVTQLLAAPFHDRAAKNPDHVRWDYNRTTNQIRGAILMSRDIVYELRRDAGRLAGDRGEQSG